MSDPSEQILQILACSSCGAGLARASSGIECTACRTRFPRTDSGALDLRLQSAKHVSVDFELGTRLVPDGFQFRPLDMKSPAAVDFASTSVPWHLTPQLLSHFPRARSAQSLALDLGCGTGLHRAVCERAGFQWVGIDYANKEAPLLGDGHALPFRDNSFEFVLSIAVLEHIRNPFVLAREVYRVLQPGALYVGTVAFLEPFHGDSYYHHTYLGTYNTLSSAGFQIERVGPDAGWSALRAQATMGGLFPRMPTWLGTMLVWPLEVFHKLWWRLGRLVSPSTGEFTRLLVNTGAFQFVARKPLAS